ncbi:MAG: GumC family protein [Sandaracinaceae bacterium]
MRTQQPSLAAAAVGDDDERKVRRPGSPIDLHRLMGILRRGLGWLVIAAAAGTLLGWLIANFGLPKEYEAEATIRYEGQPGESVLEAAADLPAMVALASSERFLLPLRDQMGFEGASVTVMRNMLEIDADYRANIVTFKAFGTSGEGAADLANTAISTFFDFQEEERRGIIQSRLDGLTERISIAEADVAAAREAYDVFRRRQNIVDLPDEQEAALNRVAELTQDVGSAQREIDGLERRVDHLQTALENMGRTETVGGGGGGGGGARARELRRRLEQARATLSEDHPTVQALERQLAAAAASGGGGGGRAPNPIYERSREQLSEAQADLATAQTEHENLQGQLREAEQVLSRYSELEGPAVRLATQVEVKEGLVEDLNQARARLADSMQDIDHGFRPISAAMPATEPVKSKRKFLVSAGIPAFVIGAVLLFLLWRELRGLTLQTPAEVAWWGNGPVVGTTTWPRNPHALFDLVADLDDVLPEARGTMLIVGGSGGERALAEEIAAELNRDLTRTTFQEMPVPGLPANVRSEAPEPERRPAGAGRSGGPDVVEGEVVSTATELVLARDSDVEPLAGAPTKISFVQPGGPTEPPEAPPQQERLVCSGWTGPSTGQGLRRAARLADRVLVVVESDKIRAPQLIRLKNRLGRNDGVGFILVGVSDEIAKLPDRTGDVDGFWEAVAGR